MTVDLVSNIAQAAGGGLIVAAAFFAFRAVFLHFDRKHRHHAAE